MGICTPFDQVVEESDVTVCSYIVEDLEAVVIALAWSKTTISALMVRLGDIDAVIEQPVDGFSKVGIIPDSSQLSCLLSRKDKKAEQGILQNTVPIDLDVISEFHKQLHQIDRSFHASRNGTNCRVGAIF